MEYTIELDKVRVREDKVGRVVSSHLIEKYPNMIVNVGCHILSYSWTGVNEFNFIIDVDHAYGIHDLPISSYNRKIKKEVSNMCKYILGDRESIGSISCNSVIHGAV